VKMIVPAGGVDLLRRLRAETSGVQFLAAADAADAVLQAADAEAVYGYNSPALYEAAQRLRWVQAGSAGVEGYPLEMFRKRGITLTNAKVIYGIQLADHAMALILAFSRQLPFLLRAQQRQDWVSRDHYPSGELAGQVLLVLGLGGTGLELARRAKSFGMRVIATRRTATAGEPGPGRPDFVDDVHPPGKLHELLPRADWVVVCLPLVPETRDLIGARELGLMKKSAYLVNVTRGGIINTEALVAALSAGRIAGAGLDVTEPEPLPGGHPLWSMENVIITPHAAGHSPAAPERMTALLCENVRRFAAGRELLNVVDLELGY
jgi:phosphoglycerate dehydrogenase-like enzyme